MRLSMDAIRKIEQLHRLAEQVGVIIQSDRHGNYSDSVCLCAPDHYQSLPVYRRETVLFRGDVEDCIAWLRGWLANREYLRHIGISDDKISRAEEKCRESMEHDRLIHAIKTGKDRGIGQIFDEAEAPF